MIKPKKLQKGDTIGIISPAGVVYNNNNWDSAISFFEKRGYKVKISSHSKDRHYYLAGKDQHRAQDLTEFFEDRDVKAILCSRGGYGTYRILDLINYKKIEQNPKIFVGYSDITALLLAFYQKADLLTFHGPLFLSDFGKKELNGHTIQNFFEILEGKASIPYLFKNPLEYKCIKSGEAKGGLISANLSVLCGLLGSPYFPDLKGKILLLEDVGEKLYKIDRMILQLKLSGVFNQISGLLFGEFTSMVKTNTEEIDKLEPIDLIKDLTKENNIPVGYGFSSGHGEFKSTLPVNVNCYFNSSNFTLEILEPYLL